MSRLHIDRLDLDLHGIAPDAAEATARAIGPALRRELADSPTIAAEARERIDAGRIASAAAPNPSDLATRIARQIAQALRGKER